MAEIELAHSHPPYLLMTLFGLAPSPAMAWSVLKPPGPLLFQVLGIQQELVQSNETSASCVFFVSGPNFDVTERPQNVETKEVRSDS